MDLALPTKVQLCSLSCYLLHPTGLQGRWSKICTSIFCTGLRSPDCHIWVLPLNKDWFLVEFGYTKTVYCLQWIVCCIHVVQSQIPLCSSISLSVAWPNHTQQTHNSAYNYLILSWFFFFFLITFLTWCAFVFSSTQQHNWWWNFSTQSLL